MSRVGEQRKRIATSAASSWEALQDHLSRQLDVSGSWRRWGEAAPDISWPGSLEGATHAWRDDAPDAHLLVAALTRLGSRRGGNDNDAALAVVVLLEQGIQRIVGELSDICTAEDVHAAVWEEVKNAEPQLECRATRFLLKRAKQRLLRPAAGFIFAKHGNLSLDALVEDEERDGWTVRRDEDEDAHRELEDLLEWARATGVLELEESDFLAELTVVSRYVAEGAAPNELAPRYGVSPRTIRRRKADAVERLREVVPDYLAATA